MKKKLLAVFLTAALAVSMLGGCGSNGSDGTTAASNETNAETDGGSDETNETTSGGDSSGNILIGMSASISGLWTECPTGRRAGCKRN